MKASLETDSLSLYIYIPFCQSRCWFCGCTKIISYGWEPADASLVQLKQDY